MICTPIRSSRPGGVSALATIALATMLAGSTSAEPRPPASERPITGGSAAPLAPLAPPAPPAIPAAVQGTDPQLGCRPGAGDCFTPHGGPGCEWGPCCEVVCAIMPECCINGWDQLCVDMAEEVCELPPACEVGLGDCLRPDKKRGCGDRGCCELVCAFDSFCCTSRWDSLCAAAAMETCGTPDCVITAAATLDEGEVCGEPINDGCDQPEAFAAGAIGPGDTLLGRTYAIGRRDVDWYALPSTTPGVLTVRPAFPAEVSIMVGDCTNGFAAVASINVPACGEGSIAVPADGRAAWVVITPGRGGVPIVRGIPCTVDTDPPRRTFGDRYTVAFAPPAAN